ncbi:unnamed protein product [Prunus brigantina]
MWVKPPPVICDKSLLVSSIIGPMNSSSSSCKSFNLYNRKDIINFEATAVPHHDSDPALGTICLPCSVNIGFE